MFLIISKLFFGNNFKFYKMKLFLLKNFNKNKRKILELTIILIYSLCYYLIYLKKLLKIYKNLYKFVLKSSLRLKLNKILKISALN